MTAATDMGSAPAPASAARARALGWLQDNGVYVALAMVFLVNVVITDNFLTTTTLRTQLIQVTPVLIVALGLALVIGTEGIDLSVGSTMALAAAVVPLYLGYGVAGAILVAVVAGVCVGLVNGWLVAFVGVQPIVATLALLVGGRGLAVVIAEGRTTYIRSEPFLAIGRDEVLGVPIVVLIALVLTAAVAFLVRQTTFGRRLVAIGGNRTASELAGLPVRRTLVTVYVLAGVLAAVAGVIATSRLQAANPASVGNLIELSAITAVVVGGTPLTGGRVRILGTVAGALLMQLIVSTLITQDLPSSIAQMVQAVIIVIAVYVQRGRGGGA